jgi:uncharacterized membrane protein
MSWLVIGLLLFLGAHSVRIFADGWRTQVMAQRGAGAWKGLYTVVSLAGFALLVWGFGQARQQPVVLWVAPVALRHVAALLVLFAFILLVAAYVPGNGIKARVHHPMILSVKVWALAHLLVAGRLADVVLFGAFLVWAVLDFRSARQRDRAAGTTYPAGTLGGTLTATAIGVVAWAAMAFWGHAWLIGIAPFAR